VQNMRWLQYQARQEAFVPLGNQTKMTHDTHDEFGSLDFSQRASFLESSPDIFPAVTKVELLADKRPGSSVRLGHVLHAFQTHLPAGTLDTTHTGTFPKQCVWCMQPVLNLCLGDQGRIRHNVATFDGDPLHSVVVLIPG
jgi:hypothetical protein